MRSIIPRFVFSRRRFLKTVGVAAGAGLWRPIPSGAAETATGKPKMAFLQVNDLHVQTPNPPAKARKTYEKANEKAGWLVEEINRQRPDFVLGIGDLIHGSILEQLPRDMALFQQIFKPLQVPFYPGVGNHEVVQREGNPEYEKAYRDAYGDERVNYTFEAGGLRFIVLNNSGAPKVAAEIAQRRNGWLRDVLEAYPRQRKILACHIPLVPVRDEPILAKSFGFGSYAAQSAELLALVDQHADSILAVLSGHLHLTGLVERKGVYHISVAGTANYPCDFARFELFDDRLTMRVCQLPTELATAAPPFHGRPRLKEDVTDSTHPTADLYNTGNATERNLTIRFRA